MLLQNKFVEFRHSQVFLEPQVKEWQCQVFKAVRIVSHIFGKFLCAVMAEVEECDFLEYGNIPRLLKSVPEAKGLVSILTCPVCYAFMVRNEVHCSIMVK